MVGLDGDLIVCGEGSFVLGYDLGQASSLAGLWIVLLQGWIPRNLARTSVYEFNVSRHVDLGLVMVVRMCADSVDPSMFDAARGGCACPF